jgi:putative PIN family toxin of toxin-antitoxin system
MLRIVLDTNVIVSALISDGKPRALFKKGVEGQFVIVMSEPLLKELSAVLRRSKFKTNLAEIRRVTQALLNTARVVSLKTKFSVVKDDPKDDVIIETAYDGHVDLIVTGDGHLLKLKSFNKIKIMTVEEALNLL